MSGGSTSGAAGGESGGRRMRVVVCGTTFGRIYLAAFGAPGFPFELAGILAKGSARSQACARQYGVPLYTEPDQLPKDIDIACVVVRAGVVGGRGSELAKALMARGIHVLQEHPLHHDELADCLRHAQRHGVRYHLNTHYVHLAPVRRFLAAARELLRRQPPRYIDVACGIQVFYALFDILGQALQKVRPWAFAEPAQVPEELRRLTELGTPFRSLHGVIAGVPLSLRVQNELDPSDPDNHAHLLHRITIGTESGNLILLNTHGPVLWSPRFHVPRDASGEFVRDGAAAGDHLVVPSATPLGPVEAPSFNEILDQVWPAGVRRALLELRRSISEGENPLRRGQYHLALCRIWQDATILLGQPELVRGATPQPVPTDDLARAVAAADSES